MHSAIGARLQPQGPKTGGGELAYWDYRRFVATGAGLRFTPGSFGTTNTERPVIAGNQGDTLGQQMVRHEAASPSELPAWLSTASSRLAICAASEAAAESADF